MSERLKNKLGEELYNQILASGLKENEFDLVDGWIPKSRFDEKNKEAKILKDQIAEYQNKSKDVEDLLKNNEELTTKYATLNEKYTNDLKQKDIEILNISKSSKVQTALMKNGAKHINLLMNQIDLSKLTLDGDNLIGLEDTMTALKNDYADLFVEKQTNSNNKPIKNDDNKTNNNNEPDWNGIFQSLTGEELKL